MNNKSEINKMARYTLNIGLANPFTGVDNTIPETLTKAFAYLADIENVAVKQSETERTVVIDFNEIYGSLTVLATALDQDCIAILDNETGEGNLFGDKRDQWLPFNPKYFLTI
jgi:hypothetical protein